MAASPRWKVYDANGAYQAACKEIEAAAVLMDVYGDGSTIRFDHPKRCIVWIEGTDGCAHDSYDDVAEIGIRRYREIKIASVRKVYGPRADEILRKMGLECIA